MESSNHFLKALIILLTIISFVNSSSAALVSRKTRTTEFIKTSCSATTYPRLCITSLSRHASAIQTSPRLLAHTALSLTLNNTKSTSTMMSRLSQIHGLKQREIAAMHDCVEQLSDSVDQLRNSIGEMKKLKKGSNFDLTMNDIQTWVSAALTNDDTCTEGFAGKAMNGKVKYIVRRRIVKIAQLTSNALALINRLASLHELKNSGATHHCPQKFRITATDNCEDGIPTEKGKKAAATAKMIVLLPNVVFGWGFKEGFGKGK
ncbi:unnamed protein product [Camellia sinensis]